MKDEPILRKAKIIPSAGKAMASIYGMHVIFIGFPKREKQLTVNAM